jgi:hypothetical protein
MEVQAIFYYAGYIAALALCWGLGPVFFYPMLADLAFDVCMTTGVFSGWDIRPLMITYGLAVFVWVLVLSRTLTKTTFLAVLAVDLAAIFYRIVPELQMIGTGQKFWNATSVGIYEVWLISISVVVGSMALRSSIVAKIQNRHVDILIDPRKRFLLPIGAWAAIPPIMSSLESFIPVSVYDHRYVIASHVLVWGWVAMELPFYMLHRRLMKRYYE